MKDSVFACRAKRVGWALRERNFFQARIALRSIAGGQAGFEQLLPIRDRNKSFDPGSSSSLAWSFSDYFPLFPAVVRETPLKVEGTKLGVVGFLKSLKVNF